MVVHAEVNAHSRGTTVPGQPEILHLVARRLSTGELFTAVLMPRRPLAKNASYHVGVPESEILNGQSIPELRARWQSFVKPEDVCCGWGHFTRDQLAVEGIAPAKWLDLRLVVARRMQD